jgi:hypothetical protein
MTLETNAQFLASTRIKRPPTTKWSHHGPSCSSLAKATNQVNKVQRPPLLFVHLLPSPKPPTGKDLMLLRNQSLHAEKCSTHNQVSLLRTQPNKR